jgi:hypothetical protein
MDGRLSCCGGLLFESVFCPDQGRAVTGDGR